MTDRVAAAPPRDPQKDVEQDDRCGVVKQALTFDQHHQTFGCSQFFEQSHDGHRVGGRDKCTEKKGRGQRYAQSPGSEIADDRRGKEKSRDRERQYGNNIFEEKL